MSRLVTLFASAITPVFALAAHAADLTIDLVGIREVKGHAYVAVFSPQDAWLTRGGRGMRVAVEKPALRITVRDLPPGDYAVSVFQDLDGDGRMGTNVIGMPIEPWGMSNDAVGKFGPPTFEQCKVYVPAEGKAIAITLRG
jgi:uncharacterized protein (DUF2141 family)